MATYSMYSENRLKDAMLLLRAVLSNQMARYCPAAYVARTGQTGRGRGDVDPKQVARYYFDCVQDYFNLLGVDEEGAERFLAGCTVLEYGPGDTLGVALLLYAFGAEVVHCVDRFPLKKADDGNLAIYEHLLSLLDGERLARARGAFVVTGRPESGFRPAAVRYFVTGDGLSGQHARYDLILSRSVLEHVNDLAATMQDIAAALKRDGVSMHKVDLKSHGLDRYRELDFLTWPETAYRWMYGAKGFPNRHRLDVYRRLAADAGLRIGKLEPVDLAPREAVEFILPYLPAPFQRTALEDLRCLSFWLELGHEVRGRAPAAVHGA